MFLKLSKFLIKNSINLLVFKYTAYFLFLSPKMIIRMKYVCTESDRFRWTSKYQIIR